MVLIGVSPGGQPGQAEVATPHPPNLPAAPCLRSSAAACAGSLNWAPHVTSFVIALPPSSWCRSQVLSIKLRMWLARTGLSSPDLSYPAVITPDCIAITQTAETSVRQHR